MPQTVPLGKGWHLIGFTSPSLEVSIPFTRYLRDDLKSEWRIIYTEEGQQARPQSIFPYVWASEGFPTVICNPYLENPSDNLPMVELFKGYWIYLTEEGVLIP